MLCRWTRAGPRLGVSASRLVDDREGDAEVGRARHPGRRLRALDDLLDIDALPAKPRVDALLEHVAHAPASLHTLIIAVSHHEHLDLGLGDHLSSPPMVRFAPLMKHGPKGLTILP